MGLLDCGRVNSLQAVKWSYLLGLKTLLGTNRGFNLVCCRSKSIADY